MQVEDSQALLSLGEVDVLLLRDALTNSIETKLKILNAILSEAKAADELNQMLRPRRFTPSEAESSGTRVCGGNPSATRSPARLMVEYIS